MFLTKSDHYKSHRTIYEQICTKTSWCWGNQAGLRKLLPAADLSPGSILFNVEVSLTSILHHPTRLFYCGWKLPLPHKILPQTHRIPQSPRSTPSTYKPVTSQPFLCGNHHLFILYNSFSAMKGCSSLVGTRA